jgi:hypothetical protein
MSFPLVGQRGGQGQAGLGSEASTNNDKAKPDAEKGPEEKAKTKTEAGVDSQ